MPKKVITRRQRKAAEAKRKAEEEARQNANAAAASVEREEVVEDAEDSGDGAQNFTSHDEHSQEQHDELLAVETAPPASAPPKMKEFLGKKKFKKLERKIKMGMKCAKSAHKLIAEDCESMPMTDPDKIPPILKKLSSTSRSHNAATLNQILNNTANWYDDKGPTLEAGGEPRPKSEESTVDPNGQEMTPTSVLPLVAKICKQIKSHLNTVLPKRSAFLTKTKGVQKRHHSADSENRELKRFLIEQKELRLGSEQRPDSQEDSCSDSNQTGSCVEVHDKNQQTEGDCYVYYQDAETSTPEDFYEEPLEQEAEPMPPVNVFGNTGYFMLTGTEEQLSQQLADLAARDVVVQSYLLLPPPFMDKVEQQLNDLVANREQLVEKMRSKHGMLAPPRERRQKKSKKHKN
ncbi:uncharacterized protein Dana_GF18216 [Drosophila ananassae]|uniref:Uncharacterized protein n=1 Tax=Drosophila ananassae TaxID=7217 RepID=B3LY21_DROAN|nr:uncharacterized protein LOC6500994 [Drosophila ananassae]EDV42877.1 uncharacterized protein Dana_GF18216 [Drosophila ananassae]